MSREEEIETLVNIFGNDIVSFETHNDDIWVKFRLNNDPFWIVVNSNAEYPQSKPPFIIQNSALIKRLSQEKLDSMQQKMDGLYQDVHDIMLYDWFQWVKEECPVPPSPSMHSIPTQSPSPKVSQKHKQEAALPLRNVEIFCSEPLIDRKSKFIAFAAHAESMDDVDYVVTKLKENKDIANATHNVLAFRVPSMESYDDDGEANAGGPLLFLLQQRQIDNIVLMVSRWFGGIHLGADRFKDFCTVSNAVLTVGGFLSTKDNTTSNGKGGKKKDKTKLGRK